METKPTWRTNVRSGRAHIVDARKPACGVPTPQGGVTWGRTTRNHFRCPDCQAIENGMTKTELDRERESAISTREAQHHAFNS